MLLVCVCEREREREREIEREREREIIDTTILSIFSDPCFFYASFSIRGHPAHLQVNVSIR